MKLSFKKVGGANKFSRTNPSKTDIFHEQEPVFQYLEEEKDVDLSNKSEPLVLLNLDRVKYMSRRDKVEKTVKI